MICHKCVGGWVRAPWWERWLLWIDTLPWRCDCEPTGREGRS